MEVNLPYPLVSTAYQDMFAIMKWQDFIVSGKLFCQGAAFAGNNVACGHLGNLLWGITKDTDIANLMIRGGLSHDPARHRGNNNDQTQ
ncbi:hypothetical protein A6D6_01629 [Alcanivorax xiamenensis]|uniref:Uncharacterized protein n=1 Tax=Alcanivorax xiamenensis TaxID=1177156 RepID=A0ABQ6Y9M3_9GAMM|nr:hypothetical protein A6D6_01629 [Alcanivorax xiamenensis]